MHMLAERSTLSVNRHIPVFTFCLLVFFTIFYFQATECARGNYASKELRVADLHQGDEEGVVGQGGGLPVPSVLVQDAATPGQPVRRGKVDRLCAVEACSTERCGEYLQSCSTNLSHIHHFENARFRQRMHACTHDIQTTEEDAFTSFVHQENSKPPCQIHGYESVQGKVDRTRTLPAVPPILYRANRTPNASPSPQLAPPNQGRV